MSLDRSQMSRVQQTQNQKQEAESVPGSSTEARFPLPLPLPVFRFRFETSSEAPPRPASDARALILSSTLDFVGEYSRASGRPLRDGPRWLGYPSH